jgi:hypothetical protein
MYFSGNNKIHTFLRYGKGHAENYESNSSYNVACAFVAAVTFLPNSDCGIHMQTRRLMGRIHEMCSYVMI